MKPWTTALMCLVLLPTALGAQPASEKPTPLRAKAANGLLGTVVADLSITKSTISTSATTGATLVYTITVANAGPSSSASVGVSDTLPTGLSLVSATPTQGSCSGATTVTCTLGSLASGASATITLSTQVTATSGTISNTATVASNEADPDTNDRTATTPPLPVSSGAPPAPPVPVPLLSTIAWLALAGALVAIGSARMMRRRAR